MTRDSSQQIQVASCFGSDGPPALVVGFHTSGLFKHKIPLQTWAIIVGQPLNEKHDSYNCLKAI